MKRTLKFIKGFSLMEVLVYIAILAIMLVVITNATISIVSSARVVKVSKSIGTSAIISLERITREVRGASSVSTSSSVLDSNPGKLVLSSFDSSGNPRTIEFSLSTSTIRMKENNIDVGALSQGDARITYLVFHNFTGTSSGIRIDTTIESGTSTYYRSAYFNTSAVLR